MWKRATHSVSRNTTANLSLLGSHTSCLTAPPTLQREGCYRVLDKYYLLLLLLFHLLTHLFIISLLISPLHLLTSFPLHPGSSQTLGLGQPPAPRPVFPRPPPRVQRRGGTAAGHLGSRTAARDLCLTTRLTARVTPDSTVRRSSSVSQKLCSGDVIFIFSVFIHVSIS